MPCSRKTTNYLFFLNSKKKTTSTIKLKNREKLIYIIGRNGRYNIVTDQTSINPVIWLSDLSIHLIYQLSYCGILTRKIRTTRIKLKIYFYVWNRSSGISISEILLRDILQVNYDRWSKLIGVRSKSSRERLRNVTNIYISITLWLKRARVLHLR